MLVLVFTSASTTLHPTEARLVDAEVEVVVSISKGVDYGAKVYECMSGKNSRFSMVCVYYGRIV